MACGSCGKNKTAPSAQVAAPVQMPTPSKDFIRARAAICSVCESNVQGVCTELKKQYPDRDAIIEIGIPKPESHCPKQKWSKYEPEKLEKQDNVQ